MVKVLAEYQGNLNCQATHAPSGISLLTNAPRDPQENGETFSPTDLVSTALATCMATLLGTYADKRQWNIHGMRIEITKIMSDNSPRKITSLPIEIWFPIQLPQEEAAILEAIIYTCPVFCSLHPDMDVPVIFRWPEESAKN